MKSVDLVYNESMPAYGMTIFHGIVTVAYVDETDPKCLRAKVIPRELKGYNDTPIIVRVKNHAGHVAFYDALHPDNLVAAAAKCQ
jgi:hypothetical protein